MLNIMLILVIDNKPVCSLTFEEVLHGTWIKTKFVSEYLNWDNSVYIRESSFFSYDIKFMPGKCAKFTGTIQMHGGVNFGRDGYQKIEEEVPFIIYEIN